MSNLVPIVNLPYLTGQGCSIAWASNTTLTVGTGQWRDSTNTFDIVVGSSLTLNAAANGVNGLDTGTFAASTMYYVFLIYDQTQTNVTACLLSTSATAPVMPSANGVTYSAFRLIGCALSDGSTHFLKYYVTGDKLRSFQWDAPIVVLNAGSSSSADIDLSTAVPASNYGLVQLKTTYVPHAAAETASLKPKAATAATFVLNGIVASVAQPEVLNILPSTNSGAPTLTYALSVTTSPAALTVAVTGFQMNL